MKTLVIIAHPNIDESRVNKSWKQELAQYPNEVTVHELYKEYPDWKIDVEKEHQLLESHDHIILQFPIYWFNCTPLLKKWIDDVFTHGWAHGSNGKKLEGKKFGIAVSVGGGKEDYTSNGTASSFTMEDVLMPFKASFKYVGAVMLPYYAAYGFSFQPGDEVVSQSAKAYKDYIFNLK